MYITKTKKLIEYIDTYTKEYKEQLFGYEDEETTALWNMEFAMLKEIKSILRKYGKKNV